MADDDLDAKVKELQAKAEQLRPKYPEVTFKSFLEETPPDTLVYVADLKAMSDSRYYETPDVVLFCEAKECNGPRIFRTPNSLSSSSGWLRTFLTYKCRNCDSRDVFFAISYYVAKEPTQVTPGRATFLKVGQIPAFGPKTPSRL